MGNASGRGSAPESEKAGKPDTTPKPRSPYEQGFTSYEQSSKGPNLGYKDPRLGLSPATTVGMV